jgi:putative ABC transport system permease protein
LRAKASGGADVTNRLDQALLEARMPPAQVLTRDMFRDALEEHIRVVGEVMRMVALAVALVGAIVLCAGTGIDVLDRTRELGVLRALGATPRVVAGILLAEGAFIAALGTLLSLALSGVLIYALTSLAAKNLLRVAVPMQVSYEALGLLALGAALVVAAIGATLAVLLRRPVREALSYDG